MKGGNKDTLQSRKDRHTAKNYSATLISFLNPFFLLMNDTWKIQARKPMRLSFKRAPRR